MASYFEENSKSQLSNFDRAMAPVAAAMREGGEPEAFVAEVIADARACFASYLPQLEDPGVLTLRVFLTGGLTPLAFYEAMKARGRSAEVAWAYYEEGLRRFFASIPRPLRWGARQVFFSSFYVNDAKKIAERSARGEIPGWETRFHTGDGEAFDFGVDYVRCAIQTFVKRRELPEFGPYICLADIAMSEALGMGLTRDETIGQGCERCNFRFKKGGPTVVRSPLLLRKER